MNWKNTLSSKGPKLQLWLIFTNQIQIKNSIYIDFPMENQVKIITNLEFPKFPKFSPSENRKNIVKKKVFDFFELSILLIYFFPNLSKFHLSPSSTFRLRRHVAPMGPFWKIRILVRKTVCQPLFYYLIW